MPSCNTYHLTWVFLPWAWGISSRLLQQSAAAAPYLGQGVSPHCHPSWPSTWDSSSRLSCTRKATAPWTWALSTGGCDQCTRRGWEELPHVRGQGQKLGGPHARRVAAKRRYPTSKVRGSGQECQAAMVQERPRRATQVPGQGRWQIGATLCPRSGVEAERSYPESEVRGSGREEQPQAQNQGRPLGGPTPRHRWSGIHVK